MMTQEKTIRDASSLTPEKKERIKTIFLTKTPRSSWSRPDLLKVIKENIAPLAKETGTEWVSASQVTQVIHEFGYPQCGTNAVGDAMGKHADGLNLPTKKIGGKTHYQISSIA